MQCQAFMLLLLLLQPPPPPRLTLRMPWKLAQGSNLVSSS